MADFGAQANEVQEPLRPRFARAPRPDKTYARLWDVTDLVGLRVVTTFEDSVADVGRLIEGSYAVDFSHSTDKLKPHGPDTFGYRSLHYVCAAPVESGWDAGFRFEVQVRSALQHAWAEIEHDLGYKASVAVPEKIRRRFSRVASLLEIADQEFVSIRRDLTGYRERARADLRDREHPPSLDTVSLAALNEDPRARALDDRLAALLERPLAQEPFYPEYLVTLLRGAGYATTRDVLHAIETHGDGALSLVRPYFGFARDTWQFDAKSLDVVQRGYSLFFVAHASLMSGEDLGISRVARLAQLYEQLDYPRDPRAAQRFAAALATALASVVRTPDPRAPTETTSGEAPRERE